MKTKTLEISADLSSFFQSEILKTAEKQKVEISPQVTQYLAQVLERFGRVEAFLNSDNKEPIIQNASVINTDITAEKKEKNDYPTLAMMWLESVGLDTFAQLNKLQRLGDVALFTSGFLGGRIKRSLVDVDYYRAMGERAYEKAGLISESIVAERRVNVYFELSSRFPELVEIFNELSDQSFLNNDADILKLYGRWAHNQNERIARMLSEAGIIVGHFED